MIIQPITKENYNVLVEWWKGYSWEAIPQECLPEIGFIVNDVVAGFIYKTDSNICLMEWIIGNPQADKDLRKKSISLLLNHLCDIAKNMGYKMCFTYTKNTSLIDSLEHNEFQKTDEQMIHFLRSL